MGILETILIAFIVLMGVLGVSCIFRALQSRRRRNQLAIKSPAE